MAFTKKTDKAETSTASDEPKKFGGAKGAVDSRRFEAPIHNVRALKDQLTAIEAGLEATAKDTATIEEERRQEGATYTFNLKLEREKQLAEFAKQDAERGALFLAREQSLTAAESTLTELIGVEPIIGDHLLTDKALNMAFEAKLEQRYLEGEKKGKEAATASYNIAKQVDAANAKTDIELLKQKNTQLEAANADLKSQNQRLLDSQAHTNDTVADVAKAGLTAAAGITQQANNALGTAAGAIPGGSRRA